MRTVAQGLTPAAAVVPGFTSAAAVVPGFTSAADIVRGFSLVPSAIRAVSNENPHRKTPPLNIRGARGVMS